MAANTMITRTTPTPLSNPLFKFALSFFLLFEISLYEMTPPNKGDLTLEEYVENYNYYVKYYAIKSGNRMDVYEDTKLGNDGQFIPPGNNVLYINDQPDVTFQYSYEDNYLTGVSFHFQDDLTGVVFFNGFTNEMVYSTLAFIAAQKEYHAFNFKIKDLFAFATPQNMAFQDYHVTFGDVNISFQIMK